MVASPRRRPTGDTDIYLAPTGHRPAAAPGFANYFNVTPVGGLLDAEEGPYHASVHINGPGMEWLVEKLNPGKIVPVHTQQVGWFEERWGERVVSAGYGVRLEL